MDFQRMLLYCRQLELNNNRQWFHENHGQYEQAKDDFEELVDVVKFCVAEKADAELMEKLIPVRPKDMMYRVPRDARMGKSLPPYNPSFRARIAADRHILLPLGYFISIQPGDRSHFGTGIYCPESDKIAMIRDYIAENYETLEDILEENGLELWGERLKRVPTGYSAEHPAAEYLKFKSWGAMVDIDDEKLCDFDDFGAYLSGIISRMEPLRRFLNSALAKKRQSVWVDAIQES